MKETYECEYCGAVSASKRVIKRCEDKCKKEKWKECEHKNATYRCNYEEEVEMNCPDCGEEENHPYPVAWQLGGEWKQAILDMLEGIKR